MTGATADRSIELVVQCTNKLYIVWTSDSESLIADRAELGTIIGSAFDDEKVPSIEAGSPSGGALLKTASRLAGFFAAATAPPLQPVDPGGIPRAQSAGTSSP